METEEKQLTQEESLRIIHEMISAAKNDVKADAFIFLLWGWLVFAASLSQFILIKMNVAWNSVPWMLMPLGGLITIVYSIRAGKKDKTKTAVTESLKYTWIAFSAALLIILFFNSMHFLQVLPCIMVLYGMGLFLSGAALRFKPLIFGGIFCWICAIAGFEVQNIYQLLILAAAVMGGYIIPGYLLKMNNRK
ncbi:MAG: hypothetical protein K0S44_2101 [Bacteroidetes bacterium]|jgi:hypothetical protein|nr:hypothetical protein [Bacteroidota bacterium]